MQTLIPAINDYVSGVVLVDPATGIPNNGKITRTGVSGFGSAGVASAVAIAAGVYANSVTIKNTHATGILYLAFGASATLDGFKLSPGESLSLPFGPTNALHAIASAAATTYTIIGA